MRLLILTPEYDAGGGIGTFYRNLAAPLCELGLVVRVIEGSAAHAGERSPRDRGGVAVETLERERFDRWWGQFPAFAMTPGLRRHLAAAWAMWEQADFGAEADIIEAADWGFSFVPPAIEAKTPLIIQAHGSAGQIADHDPLEGEEVQGALERLTERSTLSLATSLQTYSIANAEFWRAETGRDVEMIRAAVPLTKGAATGAVSDRGLVIGRIQRWKGPHVLCQALDRLGEYAPGVDWFGRDTAFGRQGRLTGADLAERYPRVWNRRIEPRAPIPTVEVARRQAGALFNLVPSSWDVFNFTAAEAMASGRPTIVSTGAGASELVVDGENGFLFASEDAASLVGAIESVLTMSPLRLAEIGAAGRETVRRELDPMTIAAARIAAYRSAIATFAARAPAPIGGWLGEICRPSAVGPVGNAFLGQHPMRTLASHLVQRAWGKVGPAIGRKRS